MINNKICIKTMFDDSLIVYDACQISIKFPSNSSMISFAVFSRHSCPTTCDKNNFKNRKFEKTKSEEYSKRTSPTFIKLQKYIYYISTTIINFKKE